MKTKPDSFLPRKRLEPQQEWGDKLGWCLKRKLGEMSVFLKLPCPENVSTNTQPNFTDYNPGITDEKQRSSLLREKHLNWVKNILNSQSVKNAKGPENIFRQDFFYFPESRILFKELSESTFGVKGGKDWSRSEKSAFHLLAEGVSWMQFQRVLGGLLLFLQWKPGPECIFAAWQLDVINSFRWKNDPHLQLYRMPFSQNSLGISFTTTPCLQLRVQLISF